MAHDFGRHQGKIDSKISPFSHSSIFPPPFGRKTFPWQPRHASRDLVSWVRLTLEDRKSLPKMYPSEPEGRHLTDFRFLI